jgi:hypothetical protein
LLSVQPSRSCWATEPPVAAVKPIRAPAPSGVVAVSSGSAGLTAVWLTQTLTLPAL